MAAPADHDGWVPLRDYMEQRFQAQEERVVLATRNLDRRLEELNKLREEVVADRLRFMPRDVFDVQHDRLREELADQGGRLQTQVDDLKRSRAIIIGIGLVLVPLSGLIGAAIAKGFGI